MTAFLLDKKLSIEPEYGILLMNLVEKKRPRTVVEIGTGQGYSTSWILKALNKNNKGDVLTFDNVERSPYAWDAEGMPTGRLKKFNCEFEKAEKLLPAVINIVFHDAGHWIEHVMGDLGLVIHRIPIGGFVLVHDIVYSNDMGEKLKEFFTNMSNWTYEEKRDGCGLGIAERIS